MFLKGLILFLLTTVSLSLYINANDNFYINSSYDGIMMSVTMSFSFNEPT